MTSPPPLPPCPGSPPPPPPCQAGGGRPSPGLHCFLQTCGLPAINIQELHQVFAKLFNLTAIPLWIKIHLMSRCDAIAPPVWDRDVNEQVLQMSFDTFPKVTSLRCHSFGEALPRPKTKASASSFSPMLMRNSLSTSMFQWN